MVVAIATHIRIAAIPAPMIEVIRVITIADTLIMTTEDIITIAATDVTGVIIGANIAGTTEAVRQSSFGGVRSWGEPMVM